MISKGESITPYKILEFNQAFVDLKKIVERYGDKENDDYEWDE
ncbi:hypothetical protein QNH10_19810 [Sporosarcina thermotolerans]|nr:hypothetical protein [Sporosarcina thermotolerans]WHT48232.1 hypothetical protein QNH10_19810 [Sporosarcina thermotolerans]